MNLHSRQGAVRCAAAFGILSSSGCAVAPVIGGPAPGAAPMAAGRAPRTEARYQVSGTTAARDWVKIERLTSTVAGFPDERMRPSGRHVDPDSVAAFGTAMPPSRDVLLHFAKLWDTNKGRSVLLVHGAIHDGTSSWITPHGHEGLVATLTARGLRVFAVTFAHRHGDNLLQAEQIANAVARIRVATGAETVDVVAHSKGCVAARALLSGLKAPGMAGYQHDVRRILFIAGPHKGMDYTFRHPSVNYGLYPEPEDYLRNAPMGWTRMLYLGRWVDTAAQSLYRDVGNCFPGQAQLLARWDRVYPLKQVEPDWYTSYNGGQGFVSVSPGIDKAIAAGGNFMTQLAARPLDRNLQVGILAGDSPDVPNILNETDGPSDGVVFLDSATATGDLLRGGASLKAKTVLHLNHMSLIFDPAAKTWIADQLAK